MPHNPTVTERQAVLRERAAFIQGSDWRYMHSRPKAVPGDITDLERATAAERYKLPKTTRPRVVKDPEDAGVRWTIRGGRLRLYDTDHLGAFEPTRDRVALWADLLANPTEEVDDDA